MVAKLLNHRACVARMVWVCEVFDFKPIERKLEHGAGQSTISWPGRFSRKRDRTIMLPNGLVRMPVPISDIQIWFGATASRGGLWLRLSRMVG